LCFRSARHRRTLAAVSAASYEPPAERGAARMLTALAAGIDGMALRAARLVLDRTVMPSPGEAETLRASADFYRTGPFTTEPRRFFSFLDRAAAVPALVFESRRSPSRRRDRLGVTFESAYEPVHPAQRAVHRARPENRRAHAELWRHRGRRARGTVVALHGFGMGRPALDATALMAPALFASGLDVALFTLPLHGARTPRDAYFSGQPFTNPHVPEINEAIGQAVHDLSVLLHWLREHDDRPVGLLGLSLGGYVAALMAGLRDDLDFVVPMVAPVCIGDLAHRFMAESSRYRDAAEHVLAPAELRAAFRVHSPLAHALRIPRERVLIVAGRGDRVVPAEHTGWLWEHWGRPRLLWFSGSHVAPFGRGQVLAAIRRFLADTGVL